MGTKRLLAAILLSLSAGPAVAAEAPAEIVLITIDTLRADALGFAGNAAAKTPLIDRLAKAGKVFPNAHAHNVITLPSHTNILTGQYPFQHGVRENSGFHLDASVPTMATLLKAAGYQTAAFVAAYPLDSQFGLDRGFDVYDDHFPKGSRPTDFALAERRGDEVVKLALAWWQKAHGGKRFLWVHLFDPHAPYAPPEPFATQFRDQPYLGEVAATDSFLKPLLEPFLEGKESPALVVVTGDHGEALGDHGELTHGLFAYEPTLRVPLIVWGRGVAAGTDPRGARHVDILPTVLAAAGVKPPQGVLLAGRSLLGPPPTGSSADSYFESHSAALNRGWAPLAGLIRDGKKVIKLPLPELYDLPRDPREATNLAEADRPLTAALLAAVPAASWPPKAPRAEAPPEMAAELQGLGYVSGTAPLKSSFTADDDPKRLAGLDRKIHQLVDAYSRGALAEAVKLGREIVAARPSMPIGYSLLAQAQLESGDTVGAVEVMQGAQKGGLASDSLKRQLALSLAELGRAREAVPILEPLAAKGDIETMATLGLVLSEAGRGPEAEAMLLAVLAKDVDHPKALETLGLVALRRRDWKLARSRSEQALAANPTLPMAWNNLGVALYQLGEKAAAVSAWQRAVDLDPKLYDALFNLGYKALEQGEVEVARRALERFAESAPRARYGPDIDEAKRTLARLPRGAQ